VRSVRPLSHPAESTISSARARPLTRRVRRFRIRHPTLTGALLVAMIWAASVAVGGLADDTDRGAERDPGPAASSPVAAHPLPRGHVIGDDDLVRGSARTAGPPPALEPVGRVVTAPVLAGEPIAAARVAPQGLDGVAALVGSGRRALALPTTLGIPPLAVGDLVDVLAADDTALTTGVGVRIAVAAEVVAIDDELVTISVEPAEAARVAGTLAGGSVTLALIGAG
jgi:Flp pilus assembly protein CpaB